VWPAVDYRRDEIYSGSYCQSCMRPSADHVIGRERVGRQQEAPLDAIGPAR